MATPRNRTPLTRMGMSLLVLLALAVAILVAFPGVRTKIAPVIAQVPPDLIQENQHLIVTKEHWRLRGPVQRVELYAFWEDRDGKRSRERLLEVLEFDESGRATLQDSYHAGYSDAPQESTSWQYDKAGRLVGLDRVANQLPRDIVIAKEDQNLYSSDAYAYLRIPPEGLYVAPPSQTRVEYAPQGHITLITVTAEETDDTYQLRYDAYRNPILSSGMRSQDKVTYQFQARMTYQYDALGNWTIQRRYDDHATEPKFRFLRRITYYPGHRPEENDQGVRLTRAAFGLRGPVTAIEGLIPLERISDEWRSSSRSDRDRVEFDQDGKVVATTRWDGDPQAENVTTSEQFVYDGEGLLRERHVRHIRHPNPDGDALTGKIPTCWAMRCFRSLIHCVLSRAGILTDASL